jgi:hypothetical protein
MVLFGHWVRQEEEDHIPDMQKSPQASPKEVRERGGQVTAG